MKKFVLVTAALVALPVASVLAQNNVGCGVGTMVWNGQSGIGPQVLAVTTNGTFGNQTLGITFGTLGCAKDGVVSLPVPHQISLFTDENLDKLARDMAVGGGETINSLATLMEITPQDKPLFFQTVKTHFTQLFPNENVTSKDMLVSLNNVLVADPILKRYSYSS